ncbi:MAG: HlyD family efflux transporter periplasmic adaptor subunit [Kiloniellales bacterium]|nr:HlyD family efflux transporter periplasmic adaptor subunit [Kiloniellales bacterium]
MTLRWRRLAFWGLLGLALVVALGFVLRPQPIAVDLITAARGPLVVTVNEEGETRVKDVFVLSAPIMGRSRRIDLEVGDPVAAGETEVAWIEPIDPDFLDIRSEAQAEANVAAAEAARRLAVAEVERAEAELEFARSELERARVLVARQHVSERALDDAERDHRTKTAALASNIAALRMRESELERARSELLSPAQATRNLDDCDCVTLKAPVSGRILKVVHESEGVVQPGQALLEIGDPADLEIVSDLLSEDAVKVSAGQRVMIEQWGGPHVLNGVVERVEPFGFMKVSALGIEEQRVNVIVDFTDPLEQRARLGHGYRVELRIVLWESEDVLRVPLTALFRNGDDWALFVANDGRVERRRVTLGQRNGLEAEILEGLSPGESVVVHPSDKVVDGARIAPR